MPTSHLTYRQAVTKFYGMLVGRSSVAVKSFLPVPRETRSDETRRCRKNDTDGSRRRAEETKLRHHMH